MLVIFSIKCLFQIIKINSRFSLTQTHFAPKGKKEKNGKGKKGFEGGDVCKWAKKEEIFKNVLSKISENYNNKINGIYNSIPFGVPGLDRHVPGIMKGVHYC